MTLYHDGTNSYITNSTGDLIVDAEAGAWGADVEPTAEAMKAFFDLADLSNQVASERRSGISVLHCLIEIESFLRLEPVMHNAGNGFDHGEGSLGLENVAAHVNT